MDGSLAQLRPIPRLTLFLLNALAPSRQSLHAQIALLADIIIAVEEPTLTLLLYVAVPLLSVMELFPVFCPAFNSASKEK